MKCPRCKKVLEKDKFNEFKKKISVEIESIFNEEFPAKPDSWKCSRWDYAVICDEKDVSI